jgi:hypothetical protein
VAKSIEKGIYFIIHHSSFYNFISFRSTCISNRPAQIKIIQYHNLETNMSKAYVALLLLSVRSACILAGCDADSENKCSGSCNWNFVGQCCYKKGGDNCYNSLSMVSTQPTIDTTATIGVPNPGSGNTEQLAGTIKQIPMENNAPPPFVPSTSLNNGGALLTKGGPSLMAPEANAISRVVIPGKLRRRR